MSPRGYTTLQRVEARTGKSLSGSLAQEVNSLIEAAEDWIDQRTGRSWLHDGSPVVELFEPGLWLTLKYHPVASVSLVRTRSFITGDDWTTIQVGDYDLVYPSRGRLRISSWWGVRSSWRRVIEVTYTPVAVTSVDARVELATTDLVAFWMKGRLEGDGGITADIQSYRVGDDLQVTYRQGAMVLGIPDTLVTVIDSLGGRKMAFA
jgi:hypothetical protein